MPKPKANLGGLADGARSDTSTLNRDNIGRAMPTTKQRLDSLVRDIGGDVKIYLPDFRVTLADADSEGLDIPNAVKELANAMVARKVVRRVKNTIGHWKDENLNIYPWGSWRSDMTPMEYYRKGLFNCPECCMTMSLFIHPRPTWYNAVRQESTNGCPNCEELARIKSIYKTPYKPSSTELDGLVDGLAGKI